LGRNAAIEIREALEDYRELQKKIKKVANQLNINIEIRPMRFP
jgi:hypothetical protein